MSTTSDEMWVGASTDHEAHEHAQRLTAARIAAHDIVAALARVGSKSEHVHRKALYSDRLDSIVATLVEGSEFAVLRSDLEASLDHDFDLMEKTAAEEINGLRVCTDCAMLIANGESAGPEHEAAYLANWDGYHLVLGDEVIDFSTHPCDGCSSSLGGSRHDASAFQIGATATLKVGAKATCNKCGASLTWNGNDYIDDNGDVSCPEGGAHESSVTNYGEPRPANASKTAMPLDVGEEPLGPDDEIGWYLIENGKYWGPFSPSEKQDMDPQGNKGEWQMHASRKQALAQKPGYYVTQRGTGTVSPGGPYDSKETAEAAAKTANEEHSTNEYLASWLGGDEGKVEPGVKHAAVEESTCATCGETIRKIDGKWNHLLDESPNEPENHSPTPKTAGYGDRYAGDPRWITAKYPGQCRKCHRQIPPGHPAWYWPSIKVNGMECDSEACGKASSRMFMSDIGEFSGSLHVHGVSLTRVRLHEDNLIGTPAHDGHLFRGVDPSGNEVVFKTTKEDAQQIIDVMIGDLAGNFSGVSIEESDIVAEGMRKGAPFAGYEDFEACVTANKDKDDPEAYCGKIKHEVEGSANAGTFACNQCERTYTSLHDATAHEGQTGHKTHRTSKTSAVEPGTCHICHKPFGDEDDQNEIVADPEWGQIHKRCQDSIGSKGSSLADWARDLGIKPLVEPRTAAWQQGFDAGRLHAIDQPEAWVNTKQAGQVGDPEQEGFIAGWQYQKAAADALPQFQKKKPEDEPKAPDAEDAGTEDPAEPEEASAPPEGLDPAEMQPGQEVGLTYTLTGEASGEGETTATLESYDQATGKAVFNCETGRFAVTQGTGGNWVDAAGTQFSFSPQGTPSDAAPVPPGNPNDPAPEEDPAKKKPPFMSSRRPFVRESSLSKLLDAARQAVERHGYVNVDEQGNIVETKWGYTNEDGVPVDGSTEYATESVVGDGMILDAQTANLIVQADAVLSPETRAKMEDLPVSKIVDVMWRAVGRSRQGSLQVEAWKQGDQVEEIATGKQGYIWYKSGGDIEVRFTDRTSGYFPNGRGLRQPKPQPWTGDSYDPSMWNDMGKGSSLRCERCLGHGRVISRSGSKGCPECQGVGTVANIFSEGNPFLNDDVDNGQGMGGPDDIVAGQPSDAAPTGRPVTTKPRQIPNAAPPQTPEMQQPGAGDLRQGFQ